MTLFRNERGQAGALTVIYLTALIGMLALVLDVGSWFREQRDAQVAADAAALAAAQALPEDPAQADALAAQYLSKNRGGAPTVTYSSKFFVNDTVKVHVSRNAPGFFAKLFGVDSVDVGASATARAAGMKGARFAAPIAVDVAHPLLQCTPLPCFHEETTLDLKKTGAGAFRLLNLDKSTGGSGGKISEDWILRGYDGYMDLDWYGSDPGAAFNDAKIKDALDIRLGDELLFPVYDLTKGNGSGFDYHVIGWVGFVPSAFESNGSKGTITGEFVRVIWEGIQSESAGSVSFGARSIALVD
jgi:hypothetical protein